MKTVTSPLFSISDSKLVTKMVNDRVYFHSLVHILLEFTFKRVSYTIEVQSEYKLCL